jgi:16S rRNA (uracil1498-N3)-methyltransferase
MRLFVSPLTAGELTVRGDEHHYLAHVRRARTGDAVELLDGAGLRARAEVVDVRAAETALRVGPIEEVRALPPRVRALVPLIKGDRMDTCLEKLVEAGVDDIVVWPAARAVVKLDDQRRPARIEHYQGIAQAAARQSGRAAIPTIAWADSLTAAIATVAGGVKLMLDPAAERVDLAALLARAPAVPIATSALAGPDSAGSAEVIDLVDARAFDESTEIAVTGHYQRPSTPPPDHPGDPDSATTTGRFARVTAQPTNDAFVDHVTLVSGPEGGLAPTELEALAAAGFQPVGLGPRVLRAETAPVICVALIRTTTSS